MKTFYSEYIQHCMRFYARHPHPIFRSEADKKNWLACDSAMRVLNANERDMLLKVYTEGDTIPDNIHKVAAEYNVKQDVLWRLVNELEKRVARRRGLL